jgi:hypothetical protein
MASCNELAVAVVVRQIEQLALRRRVLRNTRLVIEHQPQGDLAPAGGHLRQVPGQGVVQVQFVFVGEHHDGDRRELFADGAQLKHGARRDGHGMLERGHAIAFDVQRLAVLHHRQRNPRDVLALHFRPQITIHGGTKIGRLPGRR